MLPITQNKLGNSAYCSNEEKLSMQIFGLAFKVKPLYIMVGMATRTDGAAYKEWQTDADCVGRSAPQKWYLKTPTVGLMGLVYLANGDWSQP